MSLSLGRPTNIGILAAEIYFPKRFVSQQDLETADGCPGKYTVGLGQINMAFVDDREDVATIMLTAVQSLLEKYNINPSDVGRLEVGTETLIDKAKSVKTTLMPLFEHNNQIEGVTSINACYGGTAALFNTVAWIESSDYDGRYGIMVCGDIAVYEKGAARPTGGCAAIALLIGPNAPFVVEPGVRGSHFLNIYDFYKPSHSEYPAVDGKLSQWAYLSSVDNCYVRYAAKLKRLQGLSESDPSIDVSHFDYFTFHSPYNKLAQKGFARLYYVDYLNKLKAAEGDVTKLVGTDFEPMIPVTDVPQEASYEHRDVETALKNISNARFVSSLMPACAVSRNIGNSYAASVFCGVISLLGSLGVDLVGKRVMAFSYGSGSAASIYSYFGRVADSQSNDIFLFGIPPERRKIFTLDEIKTALDLTSKLSNRRQTTLEEFNDAMKKREDAYEQVLKLFLYKCHV